MNNEAFHELAVRLVGEENATLLLYACAVVGLVFVTFLYFWDRERSAAFKRKQLLQNSQRRIEIEHATSGSRKFCIALFWIFGGLFGLAFLVALIVDKGVLSFGILWLGSLLLFGIGALLSRVQSTMYMIDPPQGGG